MINYDNIFFMMEKAQRKIIVNAPFIQKSKGIKNVIEMDERNLEDRNGTGQ